MRDRHAAREVKRNESVLRAIMPVNLGKSVSPISPLIVSSYPGPFRRDVGDRLINFYDLATAPGNTWQPDTVV